VLKTAITSEPIVPAEVLAGFTSGSDGVCLLFLGVVRDQNEGRAVSGLEYEAYEGMAERTLAAIASEASRRFGTDRIRVLHRVGKLRVGEVSTAIAVATTHRAEAYEASRYVIEELKQRLPVWKREHYLEGDSHWIASKEGENPRDAVEQPGGDGGRGER
jgi:molybdopterin synthase catalytic subunit